ncbi:MAG: hypothetical protein E6J99_10065 [Methanobacteriota archaeon]|nr:MAG: hypothetical protein E6J99_10065 [Euryarchaeota archaeon]
MRPRTERVHDRPKHRGPTGSRREPSHGVGSPSHHPAPRDSRSRRPASPRGRRRGRSRPKPRTNPPSRQSHSRGRSLPQFLSGRHGP